MYCRIFCPLPSFVVWLSHVGVFGLALSKIVDLVCWLVWRADGCVLLSIGCPDVLDRRMLRVRRPPLVLVLVVQEVFPICQSIVSIYLHVHAAL